MLMTLCCLSGRNGADVKNTYHEDVLVAIRLLEEVKSCEVLKYERQTSVNVFYINHISRTRSRAFCKKCSAKIAKGMIFCKEVLK